MQNDHNPQDETIAFNNFEEAPLLGWNFPACMDELLHDQHRAVQHQHVYSNNGTDSDCLADMWKNWLNISSEPQTIDDVFGVSSSPCISPLPNFSSQTSANILHNSNARSPADIKTSVIQPSPLSYEHDLLSFYENNHVSEQLDTSIMGSLMAPYPAPPEMNLMAPTSPPPVDVRATGRQPLSCLKAKASSQNMKTAGVTKTFRNNGARKNEEAETCMAKSIEDGYAWHKYGQKSIKNRKHPRGYFKCAHPNCPVKKQIEGSSDMQGLLMITNFGKHNHSRPPVIKHREVS